VIEALVAHVKTAGLAAAPAADRGRVGDVFLWISTVPAAWWWCCAHPLPPDETRERRVRVVGVS